MRHLALLAIAATLLTACTSSTPASVPPPFKYTGTWSGLFVSQLSRQQSTLTLTQTGSTVSGSLKLLDDVSFSGQAVENYVKTTGTAKLRDVRDCAFIFRALGDTRNDSIQVNPKLVPPCSEAGLQNPEWNGLVFRD